MDFQGLKQGNAIYIIERNDTPSLVIGEVVSANAPHYPVANPAAVIGTGIKQVVDITAKAGERIIPLNNLAANAETETYNNGVQFVSASQDAALKEVDRMIADSKAALAKVDYHNAVVAEGEKMLEVLNPQYKESKAQQQDIADLREQMGQLMEMVAEMQNTLKSTKNK